jgi:hypothetical protein
MSIRSLNHGIDSIKAGRFDEGIRLITIALKSEDIKGAVRAGGYIWLAEATTSIQEKRVYYQKALTADPGNEIAQQKMASLMTEGLSPISSSTQPYSYQNTPSQGMPPVNPQPAYQQQLPQHDPNAAYPTVGILNGPNDRGTGFFVTLDGIIATTRFVVGALDVVQYELKPGQVMNGRVVRSFPVLDLVFIHTDLNLAGIAQASNSAHIPPRTALTGLVYDGANIDGHCRETASAINPDWFPTNISTMHDAGGNPLFDERNLLVGMLTKNANRSYPYFFGLNIHAIYRQLQLYRQETSAGVQLIYCPVCGGLSMAGGAGGFYCEKCGSTLPTAKEQVRYPSQHHDRYYETNQQRPCPHCGSRSGQYKDRCLRCGKKSTGIR